MSSNAHLPDVALKQNDTMASTLNWVGMEKIAVPVDVPISEYKTQQVTAKADVFVSLDEPNAKGIHMSRLYIRLKDKLHGPTLNTALIAELLQEMIESQQGLSHAAKISLQFELNICKPALLSDEFGYQSYPVSLTCEYNEGKLRLELQVTVPYSSTCPCSAALSRQALKESIQQQFTQHNISQTELLDWLTSEKGSIATPHSQRSYAYLVLRFNNAEIPLIPSLIIEIEDALGTPVQTAVKREDEQAFAKLNAENLMFCEDAARRVKHALEQNKVIEDYWFKVEHQESLHAHNAVVIHQKSPN